MPRYQHTAIEEALALESAQAAAGTGGAVPTLAVRILWPALGCPAVVAPRSSATATTQPRAAHHRVCVLLLSNRERLSAEDAAAYLRLVPWPDRARRHVRAGEPGSFSAAELQVRSDVPAGTLTRPQSDRHGEAIVFGGDRPENSVAVSLARRVRAFYRDQGLRYLHEICVSEHACARLADGQYHVMWNGRESAAESSSDEMTMLIDRFAVPRRRGKGSSDAWRAFFRQHESFLINEYRFDYGGLHQPYQAREPQSRRTEVLHPVFIRRQSDPLKVAHVTDAHVDTRMDVYEENLKRAPASSQVTFDGRQLRFRGKPLRFNNWNESFVKTYDDAKSSARAILMTGDLIDYGRGHIGLFGNGAYRHRLADDGAYHEDRNWFLFYYLLASGTRYEQPVYTILGNHDWRLNPYPPFAPGAPEPRELIHNYRELDEGDALSDIVKVAHGPGHDQTIPMYGRTRLRDVPGGLLNVLFPVAELLDVPGSPLQTTDESIAWYLLLINPFLDYALPLPGGQQLLMLDWAEDEEILDADWMRRGTPRPANSLTPLQRWHVTEFVRTPGRAKIVGVHTPPLGPASAWTDEDLQRGEVTYARRRLMRRENGQRVEVERHTLYAIRPRSAPIGVAAEYGSLSRDRAWLVELFGRSGVRLVVSGHIHRDGLLVAPQGAEAGSRRLLSLAAAQAIGGAPLYVNTNSAGPRGYQYYARGTQTVSPRFNLLTLRGDGVIGGVQLRQLTTPAPQARPAASPASRTSQISLTYDPHLLEHV